MSIKQTKTWISLKIQPILVWTLQQAGEWCCSRWPNQHPGYATFTTEIIKIIIIFKLLNLCSQKWTRWTENKATAAAMGTEA